MILKEKSMFECHYTRNFTLTDLGFITRLAINYLDHGMPSDCIPKLLYHAPMLPTKNL
jgi:hypothetical protein